MNAPRSRQYRRVAQACENCRRKKIRCPGERPQCSACSRLHQPCSFDDDDCANQASARGLEARMSDRLTQLEDKLDNLINRVVPESIQEITPSSSTGRNHRLLKHSPGGPQAPNQPIGSLPAELTATAIDFYFQHIHLQPLWLVEDETLSPSNASEEFILALTALRLTYQADELSESDRQEPHSYIKTARTGVMLDIVNGSVTGQSIRTFCLLAYFSLVSGNMAQAGLDISLAKNTAQMLTAWGCFPGSLLSPREQSRLFWSIEYLSTICENPSLLPSIPDDIDAPRFMIAEPHSSFTPCPRLPRTSDTNSQGILRDQWAQSIRLCSLWRDIRLYIASCTEGYAKYPWLPDSDYTRLCSRLLEVEMAYPSSLSYNSVGFPDISPEDVHASRLAWLPWLRAQLTYHTIHCVLNHPSLYILLAKKPRQKLGSNTFWRISYEKALRHCTWVSRLLRLGKEKGLQLSDPFAAQAAAIAGTLHLYWTNASSQQLRTSSLENLETCKNFIGEMATHWPFCKILENNLHQFIEAMEPSMQQRNDRAYLVASKTSLIWNLLDIAASQFPSYNNHSLDSVADPFDIDNRDHLPLSATHSPPTDMRESTAHYASPPPWLTSRTASALQNGTVVHQGEQIAGSVQQGDISDRMTSHDLAWGPWENLGAMEDDIYINDSWWGLNQF